MLSAISQYKFYMYTAVAAIIIASISGTAWYINHLQSENATLTENVATLKTSIKEQKEAIEVLIKDIKKIQEVNKNVADVRDANNKKFQELDKKFNGNSKPFSKIAYENTQLVEDVINKAAVEKLRCFELLTGQKAEKNETNSLCPDYIN